MAYQFTDSFDHYNTAFLNALGMYEAVNGTATISSAYARFPAVGSYPNQGVYISGGAGVSQLNAAGHEALGLGTDVSDPASVEKMATEIAEGGDAYPPGVRDLCRRLAEDCETRAQTLEAISART